MIGIPTVTLSRTNAPAAVWHHLSADGTTTSCGAQGPHAHIETDVDVRAVRLGAHPVCSRCRARGLQ